MPVHCSFFRDSHDRYGQPWAGEWSALARRLARHDEGEKDGAAIACATFQAGMPRGSSTVVARSLIALDIETSRTTGEIPPPMDSVASQLATQRQAAALWTTHSHTPDAPRYRVVLPLDSSLPYQPDIDPFLTRAVAATLNLLGVCDASKFGAASLFFLARHPVGAVFDSTVIDGTPLNAGILLTIATTLAQDAAMIEAERSALRAARQMPPEILQAIERYNATHAIAERLLAYGYRREGNRWRSRYQHGIGATVILPDESRWVSFSESDAAAGVGNRPARNVSPCACFGDAWSLFVHYEHDGSFRRALAAVQTEE